MSVPQHIAIIMDGNGRWAKKRGLPRVVGHHEGVESVRAVVRAASDFGVRHLTLYTFSTENWQRPGDEVSTLMKMLKELIIKETPDLHKNNVRVRFTGRIGDLAPDIRDAFETSMEVTKHNTGLTMCLAISYGGRAEIIDAVKKVLAEDRQSRIDLGKVDEEWFAKYLYNPDLPDPDILIRTGCEKRARISNFLLWQSAYTEFYFTPKLWPDFRRKELELAIKDFEKRERRFGRVDQE